MATIEVGERFPHYIKRNEAVKVPRRHIFVHIEHKSQRTREGHVSTWDVGIATFTAGRKGREAKERTEQFGHPLDLWKAVSDHCVAGQRTVLWAHGLGVQIRLGDALHHLPHLGWRLVAHNLT